MTTPGAVLLSPAAFASAALVAANDLWLKRFHPGLVSGKLSDLGLLVFLPLLLAATYEWGGAAWGARRSRTVEIASCSVTLLYFVAIKTWPAATHAHVAWLSALVGQWRFRAVTDPTDLVCLPAIAIAWWTLRRGSRAPAPRG